MWLPERVLRHLDQGDGRSELARLATAVVLRKNLGIDAEFFWDDLWIWRIGRSCFPFADRLPVGEPNWDELITLPARHRRDSTDYWFHVYHPKAGDVIVDIGAGAGEDIAAFSTEVGPVGSVWAIEAHPVSFRKLGKFCAWNGFTNVRCLHYACMDEPGDFQIETGCRPIANHVWKGSGSATSVPTVGVRLDDLCDGPELSRINFLKMNIEGAERLALAGAVKTLQKTQYVCIAAHDFRADRGDGEHFRTSSFVKEFLTAMGFQLTIRTDDKRLWVPHHVHGMRAEIVGERR